MELNEFISETLKEIVNGIRDAQWDTAEKGAYINPVPSCDAFPDPSSTIRLRNGLRTVVQPIHFDVCVTSSESKSGKAGIKVVSGNIESSTSTESRIKFVIPISLPVVNPYDPFGNPYEGCE